MKNIVRNEGRGRKGKERGANADGPERASVSVRI